MKYENGVSTWEKFLMLGLAMVALGGIGFLLFEVWRLLVLILGIA